MAEIYEADSVDTYFENALSEVRRYLAGFDGAMDLDENREVSAILKMHRLPPIPPIKKEDFEFEAASASTHSYEYPSVTLYLQMDSEPRRLRYNNMPVWGITSDVWIYNPVFRHLAVGGVPVDEAGQMRDYVVSYFDGLRQAVQAKQIWFKDQVRQLTRERIAEVKAEHKGILDTMESLGIGLRRRENAVEPIDVTVKKEIAVLREGPRDGDSIGEPELRSDALNSILGLIDRAGRGFERAPAAFASLNEEHLRDIILGYLNAVFEVPQVTGESFVVAGKTDILIQLPAGAIFICECKKWKGPDAFKQAIDQVFGYVTLRQTAALLVVFSSLKSLSDTVRRAETATAEHGSVVKPIASRDESHRCNRHTHPADPEKTIDLHQMFFWLPLHSDNKPPAVAGRHRSTQSR